MVVSGYSSQFSISAENAQIPTLLSWPLVECSGHRRSGKHGKPGWRHREAKLTTEIP